MRPKHIKRLRKKEKQYYETVKSGNSYWNFWGTKK